MGFSQRVNIAFEFQKTCFCSCLLEIAFREKKISPTAILLFQSLQNAVSGVCSFNAHELLPIDQ